LSVIRNSFFKPVAHGEIKTNGRGFVSADSFVFSVRMLELLKQKYNCAKTVVSVFCFSFRDVHEA